MQRDADADLRVAGRRILNAPDNICVSPRGGFILCEDGGGTEFLHGLTVDGNIFRFAQNNVDLAGQRNGYHRRLPRQRVRGRDLQPRRPLAVLQHPEPRDHVRVTGPWRNGAL